MLRALKQRVGLTALLLLVVAAGLAAAAAILSSPAWVPAVVGVLIGLPSLYLAYLAVPGVINQPGPGTEESPALGRLVADWTPEGLGVHQVIGGGPMPTYIQRSHDKLLHALLDPRTQASRLVVLRGGSSTGKTRAAYQAVRHLLADWRLVYPLEPQALNSRLDAGIPPRTVLWLGELRQYADADGGPAALSRVADLLTGEGCIAVTTIWHEDWLSYTATASPRPEAAHPAEAVGRLLHGLPELTATEPAEIDLARGGVIDVPDRFTEAEVNVAAGCGDPTLAEAISAAAQAGQSGQVAQYLAGVPDLRMRHAGKGGNPYGQAVITAAMDAARFGCAAPLPADLVQEAAVGYLTAGQRIKDISAWRDLALAWAADELNGAVRALQPVPPPTGTGIAGYRVADYLDQEGRRTRTEKVGPGSLWEALVAHTVSASDLTRLGRAARDRGLYRLASRLWTKAAHFGNVQAARDLIVLLGQVLPADAPRAASWAASSVSLDDSHQVASLLETMRDEGISEAVNVLASRAAAQASLDDFGDLHRLLYLLDRLGQMEPLSVFAFRAAGHISLDNPWEVTQLLRGLRKVGASEAIATLLARDPSNHLSVDDPWQVGQLLEAFQGAGAGQAAAILAARAAVGVSVADLREVVRLLSALRSTGAADAVALLAGRAARAVDLGDLYMVGQLLEAFREVGADMATSDLLARGPANRLRTDDPFLVGTLLRAFWDTGADQAAAELLACEPASCVNVDNPHIVSSLLGQFREKGLDREAAVLTARAAGHVKLADPEDIAGQLQVFLETGAGEIIAALLAREPGRHVTLENPDRIAQLLWIFRQAGADQAIAAMLAREPGSHVVLDDLDGVCRLLRVLHGGGAPDEVAVLADRAVSHVSLEDPGQVSQLLGTLLSVSSGDAITALLARDPAAHANLRDATSAAWRLRLLRDAEATDIANKLAEHVASQADIDDLPRQYGLFGQPPGVVLLLRALRDAHQPAAVNVLAARAASQASVNDLNEVSELLRELHNLGADDLVAVMASRAADGVGTNFGPGIGTLLDTMRAVGATEAVTTLATRIANEADADDPQGDAGLLIVLSGRGIRNSAAALAARAADQAKLTDRKHSGLGLSYR